jgi:hypothetical protein
MRLGLFKKLLQQNFITEKEFDNIEQHQSAVSLFGELRSLLYLGIALFSAAIGVLIYKQIETIGHDVLVICIALVCAVCFIYCIRKANGYANGKINSPNFLFDYVLLLGCLLLLTFIGYIQFQYNVFGDRWGLAVFIPMLLLFVTTYYFDHIGVLSLAITNLAAWVGINATPTRILKENDFDSDRTIYAAILLGIGLLLMSFFSTSKKVKAHFSFTYKNFAAHILFIALLAGLFHFNSVYLAWFLVLAFFSFLGFRYAIKDRSFYFLVITALYGWIGLSYLIIEIVSSINADMGSVYLIFFYFILSGLGFIRLLIHYNKVLKQYANL